MRKKQDISYGVRIPLDRLMVDPGYQRNLKETWVAQRINKFNSRLLGTLEVSDRGDGFYRTMDGNHRKELMEAAGYTEARCNVHFGLTPQEEAGFFRHFNRERSSVKPYDDYRAALFQGDPDIVNIDRIIRRCGFHITPGGSHPRGISAVNAAKDIYKRGGGELLQRTLSLIDPTWQGQHRQTDGELLMGIAVFLSRHGDEIKDLYLTRKWGNRTPSSILAVAEQIKYSSRIGKREAVFRTLRDLYNSGRRTKRLGESEAAAA